jgi:hypothetical protein
LFAEESAKRPVGLSAGRRARRTPERKEACLERLIVEGLPDHLRHEDEGVLAVRTGTGVQIFAGCLPDHLRHEDEGVLAVRTGTGVQIFAGCQDDGARRQTSCRVIGGQSAQECMDSSGRAMVIGQTSSWEAVSAP